MAVAALYLAVFLFPKHMPVGIYATGLVFGARSALAVLGLVLVFRTSRILSFAQVQLGAVGAVLFFELVRHHSMVRALNSICSCAGNPHRPDRWAVHIEYWSAIVLALAVSSAIGLLVYLVVVRRFRDAPPLVGTVATIAVAEALEWASVKGVPNLFKDKDLGGAIPPPLDIAIHLRPGVLHLADMMSLVIAAVAMVALALFLSRSRTGIASRAVAENAERASTLGVNPAAVSSVVWTIAGLLSGLASVLLVMSAGGAAGAGGASSLVRVLAAAVLAGMTSLPLAAAAAIGIAVLDQGFLWSFRNGLLVDAVVFVLLLAFLLLRRQPRLGRVDPSGGSWRAAREERPVPAELAGLPEIRRLRRRTGITVAFVVIVYPLIASTGDISAATVSLIYGMVGLSLLLLTGWAGLISLGQFALAAVGGYAVAFVGGREGAPFLLALAVAALTGGMVAVAVGLPALRIRGLYLAVTTLAFALVTTNVLLNQRYGGRFIPSALSRPSIFGLTTTDERVFYYVCAAFLALTTAAVMGLRRGPTARALIATRDNDRAAQAYGINLVRSRLLVFAVSGGIAAVAGGLFTYQQRGLAVGNYGVGVSLTLFLMVVIGGLGSIAGPILGALVVGWLSTTFGGASPLYVAVLLIVLLLFAPGGLSQLVFGGRDALLRRIAARRRIRVPSLVADSLLSTLDGRAPIRPKLGAGETAAYVPVVYRLEHRPLEVAKVAATGKGAQ